MKCDPKNQINFRSATRHMLHEAISERFGNVVEVLLRIEMNQSRLLIDLPFWDHLSQILS